MPQKKDFSFIKVLLVPTFSIFKAMVSQDKFNWYKPSLSKHSPIKFEFKESLTLLFPKENGIQVHQVKKRLMNITKNVFSKIRLELD